MKRIQLKAKCPECLGDGELSHSFRKCAKCDGTGLIDVSLPEDDWYTRHCTNPLCGFNNGGCQGSHLSERIERCIMCKHPETVWIPMCEATPDEPWREHQKHLPFAQYLISLYAPAKNEELPPAS